MRTGQGIVSTLKTIPATALFLTEPSPGSKRSIAAPLPRATARDTNGCIKNSPGKKPCNQRRRTAESFFVQVACPRNAWACNPRCHGEGVRPQTPGLRKKAQDRRPEERCHALLACHLPTDENDCDRNQHAHALRGHATQSSNFAILLRCCLLS